MSPPVRVLIVDDSAFARKVLREVLGTSPAIQVVGSARDGLEALEKIAELRPDVITLDLIMPNLDGLGVLRHLPESGGPRVLIVSVSDADSELGVEALQAGALDIVRKPTALATQQLYELRDELVHKIVVAAGARPSRGGTYVPLASGIRVTRRHDIVVIGTSTGGPPALTRLLAELPGELPVPVLIALHIPPGYTEALATRLHALSALDVCEASETIELRPGLAVLARGGVHLELAPQARGRRLVLDHRLGDEQHAPSVNRLFASAASVFGSRVLGVVLTGMGDDGTRGARAIHAAGGTVLTEAELSCVVYGMPRSVKEAGCSSAEAPIEAMAAAILAHL